MNENLVRDWMTSDPITIPSNCTISAAYWLMVDKKVRRLLVVDDENLVGIVTLDDLRGKVPSILINMDPLRANDLLANLHIYRIMTENPKTIEIDADLLKAARLMLENKISTLPVMEANKLVGIITESDIFRALIKRLEVD